MANTNLPGVFFANSNHNPEGPSIEIVESQIVDIDGPNTAKPESSRKFTPCKQKHISSNGMQVSPAVLNSPALRTKQLTRNTSSFSVDVENMQLHMEVIDEKKSWCPATTDVVFFFAVIMIISFVIAILIKSCMH
uniref:Uncharacterized protein n=1 Tax=Ditylenchus dipsaci TaxID=166011 RepID=A0A915EVT0_9BILA